MPETAEIATAETVLASQGRTSGAVHAWLGARVGSRYRIVEHIASGGMGHVFLAHDRLRLRPVAVKLLANPDSPRMVACFVEEARLLTHQQHPNVVRGIESGATADGTPYLAMEYVYGDDLSCWLRERPALSHARLLHVLRQLAAAVDHLHQKRIVHRDIKPANVRLDERAGDAVKLLDFGIAVDESRRSALLTDVAGTPTYMAPEQASGALLTRAVDLYALGALAFELLTGRPPYGSESLCAVLYRLLHEPPPVPSMLGVSVPGLDAVFERALARIPYRRFATATEFVNAMTSVLGGN